MGEEEEREAEGGRRALNLSRQLDYSRCFSVCLKYVVSFLTLFFACGKIYITNFTILDIFKGLLQ